jgi:hypothetical protein
MNYKLEITTVRPLDLLEDPLSVHYQALETYYLEHSDHIHLYDAVIILDFDGLIIYALREQNGLYEVLLHDTYYSSRDLLAIISLSQNYINEHI